FTDITTVMAMEDLKECSGKVFPMRMPTSTMLQRLPQLAIPPHIPVRYRPFTGLPETFLLFRQPVPICIVHRMIVLTDWAQQKKKERCRPKTFWFLPLQTS